ncbi:MAG: hypothetical protein AVDCRST_MAG64-1186, partial [uncultured Phycisphaerae bacterium]
VADGFHGHAHAGREIGRRRGVARRGRPDPVGDGERPAQRRARRAPRARPHPPPRARRPPPVQRPGRRVAPGHLHPRRPRPRPRVHHPPPPAARPRRVRRVRRPGRAAPPDPVHAAPLPRGGARVVRGRRLLQPGTAGTLRDGL